MAKIEVCPFRDEGVVIAGRCAEPSVVCSKMISGEPGINENRLVRRRACVGENDCPDMQTHRAVMKLLATLEAVNKVL